MSSMEVAPVTAAVANDNDSAAESDYEDEQIRQLEKKGGQNYFGSQSMLSQEMHAHGGGLSMSQDTIGSFAGVSQLSTISMGDCGSGDNSLSKSNSPPAVDNFDSQQMVQQYGLLSQEPGSGTRRLDTASNSQGGFGTLLDAVSMFQSQEEEQEAEQEKQKKLFDEDDMKKDPVIVDNLGGQSSPSRKTTTTTTSSPPKRPTLPLKRNSGNSSNIVAKNTATIVLPPNKKRKRKEDIEQLKQQQQQANRAADLAQRTINDPELAKRLLLSMALTRENPRSAPETLPGPGHVLPEGFFWAHYPPLEKVLKDNMAEYYELSITKCQSAQQQSFNNTLVELVRAESNRQQWVYAECFTDKTLRDRIRCYYKTHIQNAKKRLRTMIKNPTKKANARHLCAHLDMIEKNVQENAADNNNDNNNTNNFDGTNNNTSGSPTNGANRDTTSTIDTSANHSVITHKDWGSSFAGDIAKAADGIVKGVAVPLEERVATSVAAMTAKSFNQDGTATTTTTSTTPTTGRSAAKTLNAATKAFPNRGRHRPGDVMPPLDSVVATAKPETPKSTLAATAVTTTSTTNTTTTPTKEAVEAVVVDAGKITTKAEAATPTEQPVATPTKQVAAPPSVPPNATFPATSVDGPANNGNNESNSAPAATPHTPSLPIKRERQRNYDNDEYVTV